MQGDESNWVCVTGATGAYYRWSQIDSNWILKSFSGFIAGHVIEALLKGGYNVRATIRSKKDKDKIRHLLHLQESYAQAATLEFHEADLLQEGSFDKVIKGIISVPLSLLICVWGRMLWSAARGLANHTASRWSTKTTRWSSSERDTQCPSFLCGTSKISYSLKSYPPQHRKQK